MFKNILNIICSYKLWPFWLIVSMMAYSILAYGTERTEFSILVILWFIVFTAYLLLGRLDFSTRRLIVLAVFLRLIFLLSIPALSDDFYRFIWDGQLIVHGQSPYGAIPSEVSPELQHIIDSEGALLKKMNSADYYSVYPPLHQIVFATAAALGRTTLQSVVVMRVIIVLFEIALIVLLIQLLKHLKMPAKRVGLYAFNPLVIVEATGNLHLESIMMAFFIAGILMLLKGNFYLAGMGFGASYLVKLSSAIYLPILFFNSHIRKSWKWITSAIALVLCASLLLLSTSDIINIGQSIDLYFRKFEFNASLYYIAREAGVLFTGYNLIDYIGPAMSFISMVLILIVSLKRNGEGEGRLFISMCWIALIYLLFSTTVHPWYLIPLLVLMIPAGLNFPIVWSILIVLSYSAYSGFPFRENYVLIIIEYALLGTAIWLEWWNPKFFNSLFSANADGTP